MVHLSEIMACNPRTAGHRAKWSNIWDSGISLTHIWGTYDLVVFEVTFEPFSAFVSKWHVTRKRLVWSRKGGIFLAFS